MSNGAHIKSEPQDIKNEPQEDMMKFVNVDDHADGSELDLSEDGVSSVASSADMNFDGMDPLDFTNSAFDNGDFNWLPADSALDDGMYDLRFGLSDVSPGMSNPGLSNQGLSNQRLPNTGMSNTGMSNTGMSNTGMSNTGMSNTGVSTMGSQPSLNMGTPASTSAANGLAPGTGPNQGYANGLGSRAHELLQHISFGASDDAIEEYSVPQQERSLYGLEPAEEAALEYHVEVEDFPSRSRVETQIKCRLTFRRKSTNEPPNESLLHLPSDTIARPRFQMARPDQLVTDAVVNAQTLWLSVEAVNPDMPGDDILMCSKCLGRERRRAFRKKAMDPHEETYWNRLKVRRIIIFNCREVVPVSADGQVELPLRIACYCRHHAAKNGYRLVFGLRNNEGRLLGRAVSTNVFITDSHKDQRKASTHSLVSPAISNPTTPSSVSSQESLPLSSSHLRRASSASSISMQYQTPQPQQNMHAHAPAQAQHHQPPSQATAQNHPYMRPAKPHHAPPTGMQPIPNSQLSRQIQQSQAVPSWIAGLQVNEQAMQPQAPSGPTIFRVIPPTGSVRGGVEVTLLGQNFRQGMVAMFGDAQSVNTQCWSDSTIIAHLPPSNQPGPVPVTFQGEPEPAGSPAIFTYVNDGEEKLKEIALQMIGYKMTGKIEDAGDIAQRIVVNDDHRDASGSGGATNAGSGASTTNATLASASSAGGPIESITESAEQFALWVLHNMNKICPSRLANVNLRNSEGQSMLHLASMLGYASIVKALISSGAYIDIQDVSGLTSLHFAVLFGNRNVTRLLLLADADPFHRTLNGMTALDLADVTVEDLLPKDQRAWYNELNRRGSSSSIASMINEWRNEIPNFTGYLTPEHTDETSELDSVDYTSDDSESTGVTEGQLRKPPSYSKLFPGDSSAIESEGPVSTVASVRHRRSKQKFQRSLSRGSRRHRSTRSVPVIDIEVTNSEPDEDEGDDDEDAEVEPRDPGQEAQRLGWIWNPKCSQEIWNDKMLFTFWIPLSLLTIAGILTIYVIQSYGRADAHPLATKIGDIVANFVSGTMDHILPMPRGNQATGRTLRAAK